MTVIVGDSVRPCFLRKSDRDGISSKRSEGARLAATRSMSLNWRLHRALTPDMMAWTAPPRGRRKRNQTGWRRQPQGGDMSNPAVIGLDIAKNVFQVHGADIDGRCVLRRRLRRAEVIMFFARLPRALVGIEACPGGHHWARELCSLGHDVRLIPPQYVRPFVKPIKTTRLMPRGSARPWFVPTCASRRSSPSSSKPR
jgi:hypothetical protein